MKSKIIPNFFILCIYYLAPYLARILCFLPSTTKQCFNYHRLSSTIVSLSGQYLSLAARLRQTAKQRHANGGGMSLSYLWLRLVSCKKR